MVAHDEITDQVGRLIMAARELMMPVSACPNQLYAWWWHETRPAEAAILEQLRRDRPAEWRAWRDATTEARRRKRTRRANGLPTEDNAPVPSVEEDDDERMAWFDGLEAADQANPQVYVDRADDFRRAERRAARPATALAAKRRSRTPSR